MSYDLSIRSDLFATLAVPTPNVQQLLNQLPGVSTTDSVHFEVTTPRFKCYLRLIIDEIDGEGNSVELIRRMEAGESLDEDFVPERINEISVQMGWGLDPQTHRDGMSALWQIADQLGWRVLDHQEGRFVRPSYGGVAFLPPQNAPDTHRRMALALKAAGAQRASQTPSTGTDHGRLHGYWGDWGFTLRYCTGGWAAQEARHYSQVHGAQPPWDRVRECTSFIEFWGDFDDGMEHINDYMYLCEGLEAQFPGCVIIGPTGEPV